MTVNGRDTIISLNPDETGGGPGTSVIWKEYPVTGFLNVTMNQAINELPPQGGKLYLLPGTARYQVDAGPINLSKPVEVVCVGNVTIEPANDTISPLIDVTGDNVRWRGGTFTDLTGSTPVNDRDIFLVNNNTPNFVLEHALFSFQALGSGINKTGIRVGQGGTPAWGASILNCAFQWLNIQPGDMGSVQTPTAYVGIRGDGAEHLTVQGCRFAAQTKGTPAYPGGLVHLRNCQYSKVVGNFARLLYAYGETFGASVLFRDSNSGGEDGHIIWSQNTFHECGALYILEFNAAAFSVCQNNTFGKIQSTGSVIFGSEAIKMTISNNDFHNWSAMGDPGAPTNPVLSLLPGDYGNAINLTNKSRKVLVHGNIFSEQAPNLPAVRVDKTCEDIRVDTQNQPYFLKDEVPQVKTNEALAVWEDSFSSESDPPLYPKTKRSIG